MRPNLRSRSTRRTTAVVAIALLFAAFAALVLPSGWAASPPRNVTPAKRAPVAKPPARSRPPASTKTPIELAREVRALEELGGYGQAVEVLRQLRRRTGPDTDLEIALALDEARAGQLDSAWVRLNSPLMMAGLVDSLPQTRRTDYPWEREGLWINGRFDGWHWYIARARAEVAARLGLWPEARDAATHAVAARPLAGKEWLILAVCAGRAGDQVLAAGAAHEAAFLDQSLPEAQYLYGFYEWKAGRRSAGQTHFRIALVLDSTYMEPALALVRSRMLSAQPDSLPTALLTGVREVGLLTSPARPKLEEFVQNDIAGKLLRLVNPIVPDSLRGTFPEAELSLSILVDESGRVVLHELPWYEPFRFPAPMVSLLTDGLPSWRVEPARRFGAPHRTWMVIQLSVRS